MTRKMPSVALALLGALNGFPPAVARDDRIGKALADLKTDLEGPSLIEAKQPKIEAKVKPKVKTHMPPQPVARPIRRATGRGR